MTSLSLRGHRTFTAVNAPGEMIEPAKKPAISLR